MPTLRRFIVPLWLVSMFLVQGPAASAAPLQRTVTHQIVREAVTWSIPAGQCPNLPSGVSVSGSGDRYMVIITQWNADGSRRMIIADVVKGAAVDSNGMTYQFIYRNESRRDIAPDGVSVQVNMADSFVLRSGDQAPQIDVAFVWSWTFTLPNEWPPVDNWQQTYTRGDPIACDPI